jgi:acetyltransferase-like isoleucine patch superfamily enzyme
MLHPLTLRLGRFLFEILARAQLRGVVAPGVQFTGPIHVEGTGNVHIGAGTRVGRRVFFETYGDARIEIGPHVTINDGVFIVAHSGVAIGEWTMIGEYAAIRDANHGMAAGLPVRVQPHASAPIHLGADTWVGRNAIILPGVRLEPGAVIGANAVVRSDVPAGAIAAGVPARVVGARRHTE